MKIVRRCRMGSCPVWRCGHLHKRQGDAIAMKKSHRRQGCCPVWLEPLLKELELWHAQHGVPAGNQICACFPARPGSERARASSSQWTPLLRSICACMKKKTAAGPHGWHPRGKAKVPLLEHRGWNPQDRIKWVPAAYLARNGLTQHQSLTDVGMCRPAIASGLRGASSSLTTQISTSVPSLSLRRTLARKQRSIGPVPSRRKLSVTGACYGASQSTCSHSTSSTGA